MSAGTLTLTNKSAAVSGTGTSFTTELKAGDFIVVKIGGTPYTLPVKTITSNTQLTLVSNYTGPTQSGVAWFAVPQEAQSLITAALASQTAEALRGLNLDKTNWQQVFSSTGNITVRLPDGSTFSGPSWQYMVNTVATKADKTALDGKADKVDGAVPVSEGGTGSTSDTGARKNLGLGSAAVRNIHTDFYGDTTGVGVALQTNADFRSIVGYDDVQSFPRGVSGGIQDATKYGATGDFVGLLSVRGWGDSSAPSASWQIAVNSALQAFRIPIRAADGFSYLTTYKIWNQRNTTVDGNGFIKQASPIARLTSYPEIMPPTFTDGGFSLAGVAAVNLEAEGVTAERVDTGVYRVSGAFGLHPDGWTIEIPQDNNGNRLCFVETDVAADGVITVSVFKRRFDIDTAMIVAGDPMDIPPGRWIDLRLEMPVDSIFNQKMNAAEGAVSLSRQEQTDNS
ncbi:phage tail protein [Cronobacter sakazakii]|uniref:phage tail fiber protein n=1 Tax=Cronobacter sakazakii TaxID=28141 RepID=UPI002893945B|nr:phage tail protein [Cronobacter sakazakii]MDT3584837.1 phage tail protein [Cronobacter sakazakii]